MSSENKVPMLSSCYLLPVTEHPQQLKHTAEATLASHQYHDALATQSKISCEVSALESNGLLFFGGYIYDHRLMTYSDRRKHKGTLY